MVCLRRYFSSRLLKKFITLKTSVMKKLLSAILIVVNLNCFGQASKWFVSVSATPTIGGPSTSIKHQMVVQGFDQTSDGNFLGWSWTTHYPKVSKSASVLLRGGKKMDNHRSIYFVAGLSAKGTVDGFRDQGYSSFFGIISGSYGEMVSVDYNVYQLTAGYLYSFTNTRAKIGFGPSVFLLDYSVSENYTNKQNHSSVMPGASFTTRIPLGKEKKLFGVELVFEGSVAPPAKMKAQKTESGFQVRNANLIHANAGLAFCFRR